MYIFFPSPRIRHTSKEPGSFYWIIILETGTWVLSLFYFILFQLQICEKGINQSTFWMTSIKIPSLLMTTNTSISTYICISTNKEAIHSQILQLISMQREKLSQKMKQTTSANDNCTVRISITIQKINMLSMPSHRSLKYRLQKRGFREKQLCSGTIIAHTSHIWLSLVEFYK